MYYILTCPNRKYYTEGRVGTLPKNIISICTKDPLGDWITDICCYDIQYSNNEYTIKVNYKQWFQTKENK